MKKAAIIVFGMIMITGLVIVGGEANSIGAQFVTSTVGLLMFGGGAYALTAIARKE